VHGDLSAGRHRRGRRSAGGFTLVELLVAVTIMGVVIGALCGTLVIGLSVGPQTSGRTRLAVDTSFLTNTLSDDVANAAQAVTVANEGGALTQLLYTNDCTVSFKGAFQGPWALGPVTDVVAYVERAEIARLDGSVVVYQAVLRPYDDQSKIVEVLRYDGEWSTVLTGYCQPSANPVVSVASGSSFSWALTIASSSGAPAHRVEIGGDRRTV
jgi:prepilin-type N-terminal cleavage/methylation domain-containing protein